MPPPRVILAPPFLPHVNCAVAVSAVCVAWPVFFYRVYKLRSGHIPAYAILSAFWRRVLNAQWHTIMFLKLQPNINVPYDVGPQMDLAGILRMPDTLEKRIVITALATITQKHNLRSIAELKKYAGFPWRHAVASLDAAHVGEVDAAVQRRLDEEKPLFDEILQCQKSVMKTFDLYTRKKTASYYTSDEGQEYMRQFLRSFCDSTQQYTVMDPFCGSGKALLAAAQAIPVQKIYGIELQPLPALVAYAVLSTVVPLEKIHITVADAFKYVYDSTVFFQKTPQVDIIITNPPFTKASYITEQAKFLRAFLKYFHYDTVYKPSAISLHVFAIFLCDILLKEKGLLISVLPYATLHAYPFIKKFFQERYTFLDIIQPRDKISFSHDSSISEGLFIMQKIPDPAKNTVFLRAKNFTDAAQENKNAKKLSAMARIWGGIPSVAHSFFYVPNEHVQILKLTQTTATLRVHFNVVEIPRECLVPAFRTLPKKFVANPDCYVVSIAPEKEPLCEEYIRAFPSDAFPDVRRKHGEKWFSLIYRSLIRRPPGQVFVPSYIPINIGTVAFFSPTPAAVTSNFFVIDTTDPAKNIFLTLYCNSSYFIRRLFETCPRYGIKWFRIRKRYLASHPVPEITTVSFEEIYRFLGGLQAEPLANIDRRDKIDLLCSKFLKNFDINTAENKNFLHQTFPEIFP